MDVSMSSVRSEDDVIDDSVIEESFSISRRAKSAPRNQMTTVIAESEDDDYDEESGSEAHTTKGSIVRKSISVSSSDEINDEASPEIVPKRRPFGMKPKSFDKSTNKLTEVSNRISSIRKSLEESFIGRRGKKVMVLDDSSESENDEPSVGNEEEDDEDEMVVSAATRMSILGVRPKDMPSDESDFIQSDDSDNRISSYRGTMSKASSTSDLDELPDISRTPQKTPYKSPSVQTPAANISIDLTDDSKLSCSPISSPVHDLTMDGNISYMAVSTENTPMRFNTSKRSEVLVDLTNRMDQSDDEVKVVDNKPEVIDISSDDDNHPLSETQNVPSQRQSKKSPSPKRDMLLKEEPPSTTKTKNKENTIRQYLLPPSYPNQGVIYVSKQVRTNELQKLEGLREDLHNVKNLMKQMDLTTLPDRGVKLRNRLDKLEEDVKVQEQKVADMVVDPDEPVEIEKVGKKEKGLSWDDIQAVSNQVQPRMFGKQAMATHMAERSVTLDRLRDLHESLASRPAESALASPPAALRSPLMPHQLHALAWLQWRETQKPRGGILADDMGLGKTITMISLVATCKERLDDGDDDDWKGKGNSKLVRGGTLVVCPASLLQQWAGEVTKHCKSNVISVITHHGAARATHAQRLAHSDLVLTTYNILQRDKEKNGVLMKIRWSRVILDEAHIVRNHKAATSVAVSALEGDCRWCLTGTPVQNKDLDMFALLKFLRCTPFDDLTMWKKWIDNKSLGGQERLSTIMRCLLLRRTKEQLQLKGELTCLPERTLHQVDVTLSKEEMNVYQKVLVFSKTLFAQFLHQRAEKQASLESGFLPRTGGKSDPYAKMHNKMVALHGAKPVKSHEILVLLLRLRQLCCHCGLIAGMLDGAEEPETEDVAGLDLLAELHKLTLQDQMADKDVSIVGEEDTGEGTTVTEAIRSVLSPSNPVFNLSNQSSKVLAVIDCLKKNVFANKGEKAVIVSQWTSVLKLVERELGALSVRCVTLSGVVPVPQRAAIVDTFNNAQSSVQVMLLSLCAGGVGLNLCGGNHLLLLDPHWNPQLEQQARDRIYRVGQTKHVHIYKFVCTDTVEQSIRRLQELKLELAESVLTGARHSAASKLSIEDLKMLFNIGPSKV